MTSIISRIRDKQRQPFVPQLALVPAHRPEMLYIGCIDARLDPIDDIGIPKGKALIYRNVAALVRPSANEPGGEKPDAGALAAGGEIPESVSIGAALEFFIRYIPAVGVKHIVVSGHTDCGGIRACLQGVGPGEHYLPRYLGALKEAREEVLADASLADEQEQCRALEEASVRQSLENLATYDVVRLAMEEGKLELHGWVIDTATQRISEMRPSGRFEPL